MSLELHVIDHLTLCCLRWMGMDGHSSRHVLSFVATECGLRLRPPKEASRLKY